MAFRTDYIHFDDLGHLLYYYHYTHKASCLGCVALRLWAGVWAGVWQELVVYFTEALSTSNVFFIIHLFGLQIQIPLEGVVFLGQMKKIVGLALGRLVDCEVNMSRDLVMYENRRLS